MTGEGRLNRSSDLNRMSSHSIIGSVVEALHLGQGVLSERTAKRFYAGESVSDYSRDQILDEFGKALVGLGLVPEPAFLEQHNLSMAEIVTAAVISASSQWDRLMAIIQSESTQYFDLGVAASEFLRFVVIDLALRVSAASRLACVELSPNERPTWALENGFGNLLRQLAQEAGVTRAQLAARAEVSYTTIDNWLDGKNRPSYRHIGNLARAVTPGRSKSETQCAAQAIRRQLTLSHLATLLSDLIGRERVVELATATFRFAWFINSELDLMNRPPVEDDPSIELGALRSGVTGPESRALLRGLAYAQPDERWRRDILTASVNWSVRFQWIAHEASGRRSAAGLSQDIGDIPADQANGNTASEPSSFEDPADEELKRRLSESASKAERSFLNVTQQANRATNPRDAGAGLLDAMLQMLESGIAERRDIVDKYPDSPKALFDLGSFLGMVGKNLSRRDLVDEGILECKISAGLRPGWDGPAVEPGIMLANIGEYEEAILELTAAEETLGEATPHLSLAMGYALMMLKDHAEALERFERVVQSQPDYALANLYAARCSFALGDKTKGIRYARTARRLGEPGEFNAWRDGAYASVKTDSEKGQ